uniref:IgGFc-binding protein N-terminal domain-containing protein n=1 Tax=Biomphalaria glabrata TaxID=6526 RepID=A0A2C9KQK9_BIOGL
MSVQICQGAHYLDMYTVLPVAAWGKKYIVVTLRKNPTLQIINSMAKNEITLTFKNPTIEEIQYFTQGVGYFLKLLLRSFQSYSISKCDDKLESMTGTIIESSFPVGVITGSCLSDTEFLICNTSKAVKGKKGTLNTASGKYRVCGSKYDAPDLKL